MSFKKGLSANTALNLFGKALLALIALIYLGYMAFVAASPYGPVDYETFMEIGRRFMVGENPYGENSYYPMPYVAIFGLLSLLPRPASLVLWILLPVLIAYLVSGRSPWVLAFGPLLAHFTGGQSALPGMLGFWGYRRYSDRPIGGVWLALMMLKPQLGVIPLAWALYQWLLQIKRDRRIPKQAFAFFGTVSVMYLPWFWLTPGWVERWLANPRPFFERAMSGLIPRTLVMWHVRSVLFWIILLVVGIVLLWLLRRFLNLDTLVLWGFIVSPFVHDYDLIQIIPLLESKRMRTAAAIFSVPTWIVLTTAYSQDGAWFVVTLIAPLLLWVQIQWMGRPDWNPLHRFAGVRPGTAVGRRS